MTDTQPTQTRGYFIAVIATATWSTTAIFISYLNTHYAMPALVLAFWRDLLVAAGLWIGLGLIKPKLLVLPGKFKHLGFFVLYGFVLAVFNALWVSSVTLNGAAIATVLAYSSPAFTALFGWKLFGEQLNVTKLAAICLCILGCALVANAYDLAAWQVNPIGIAVGLLTGILFAAYSICGKASSRRGIEAWTATTYAFTFGALFLSLLQRSETVLWLGSSAIGWGILIFLSLGPTIGGYGLYTVSLTYLPASVASLITTLEPPMTAVLAFFLLGERMTWIQLAGSGIILAGVFVLRLGSLKVTNRKSKANSQRSAVSGQKWRYYPGTGNNPFHFALVAIKQIERIPILIMPFLLALIAAASGFTFHIPRFTFHIPYAFLLVFIFSLGDLILLKILPRVGRSHGESHPPALLMCILRTVVALGLGALTHIGLPPIWAVWLNLAAQIIGTLLAIEAYWFGPHRLGITRIKIRSAKLNPSAPPLRVLHLSDLHVERLTAREHEIIQHINDLKPDAILFSGDLLNLSYVDDPHAQADCRAFFTQIDAPLGVYAVTGSLPVDTPEAVQAVLDGTHIRRLDDEQLTLAQNGQCLELIGLTCTHQPEQDASRLHAMADGQQDHFKLLLYHTPDLAPKAAQLGIDLQLSGHTHGGQVRLPWFGALVTSSLYGKRFEMGQYNLEAMTLYVSRGIGMEGMGAPRVRFLCPPEMVLWEIGGAA